MKKRNAWLKGLGLVVIGALLIINVAAAQSSDTTPPTGSILINGGAASTQRIPKDGEVNFRALGDVAKNVAMCGLSNTNANASYDTIGYALYLRYGEVQVYEKGIKRGSFGSFIFTDSFQVERVGTILRYKKNGVTFYTSTVPSSGMLLVDAAIYSNPGGIAIARVKGAM